jgi:manganese/zinc/iron transport system permease protein
MNEFMSNLFAALTMRAGFNTALVCVGAALLGIAAGSVGTYALLRRRSLATDAAGHATLPGLAVAFISLSLLSDDNRWVPALMLGALCSAAAGLATVQLLNSRSRLNEDAAIGIVLSVFFGTGVVLMTVVQNLETGQQAGIAVYLLGSAASMLRDEAELIAITAFVLSLIIFALRRPLNLVCFDPDYANVQGVSVQRMDMALSFLLLTVVVISLKVVGLVLSVALTIIPAVAARFWTNKTHHMALVAASLGGIGGYVGAALSASAQNLPTGAVITLTLFSIFLVSLLLAPTRGVLATLLRHMNFRRRVHLRQGLLALYRQEPIYDGFTLRLLRKASWIRRDGVATPAGLIAAKAAAHDEDLWSLLRQTDTSGKLAQQYHQLLSIRQVLSEDALQELERKLQARAVIYSKQQV